MPSTALGSANAKMNQASEARPVHSSGVRGVSPTPELGLSQRVIGTRARRPTCRVSPVLRWKQAEQRPHGRAPPAGCRGAAAHPGAWAQTCGSDAQRMVRGSASSRRRRSIRRTSSPSAEGGRIGLTPGEGCASARWGRGGPPRQGAAGLSRAPPRQPPSLGALRQLTAEQTRLAAAGRFFHAQALSGAHVSSRPGCCP